MNKHMTMKIIGTVLLGLGMAMASFAHDYPRAPEIDAAMGMNALTLLTGALLIIRGKKR